MSISSPRKRKVGTYYFYPATSREDTWRRSRRVRVFVSGFRISPTDTLARGFQRSSTIFSKANTRWPSTGSASTAGTSFFLLVSPRWLLTEAIVFRNKDEWDKLAKWIVKNELFSDNVRWLIQIPRLYDIFKKSGGVESFEDVIRSAFFSFLPRGTVRAGG